ncbi:MAG: hydrogenase iron-sulfur subunit, partial [Promethearchaeota archaeon]
LLESSVRDINGYPGNYAAELETPEGTRRDVFGAVVLATGIREIEPNETTLYHGLPDIVNQTELAKMIKSGSVTKPSSGEKPKNVLVVNCVGSRDTAFPNCSGICCSIAIKNAKALQEMGIPTTIAYMDIRTPYQSELMYSQARSMGVNFIKGMPASIEGTESGGLVVDLEDILANKPMSLHPDMIVISGRLESNLPPVKALEDVRVKFKESGFVENLYSKLATNQTKEKGIFLAGSAFTPMTVEDSIHSANSAALKVVKFLHNDTFKKLMNTPKVDEDQCVGCRTCVEVCPYGAISIVPREGSDPEEDKGVARIEPMLCTGCGACNVFCPTRAIELENYSHNILSKKIEVLLESLKENPPSQPITVGIACQECAYCAIDVAGMTGFKYPASTYFLSVPCTGRVGVIEILKALSGGASTVLVAGCPEQSCHYQKGSMTAKGVVELVNSILKEVGHTQDRVFFETFVSNEPEKVVSAVEMVQKVGRELEGEVTKEGGQ